MRLYRSSGMPVRQDDHLAYQNELNGIFDTLESQMGKCTNDNAKEFSSKLEDEHRKLTDKYPIYVKEDMPISQKDMLRMIVKYGSAVCFCEEDGKLVAYVMDK